MGGLRIGTEDYDYIYNKFVAGEQGYALDNYDPMAIYNDPNMRHFRADYDAKQFKQSLKRMVERIEADQAANAPPIAQPPFVAPPPERPGTPGGAARPGTPGVAPAPATMPSTPANGTSAADPAEFVANDELTLFIPHHLFGWKDVDDNHRLTLLLFLPTGCTKDDVAQHIVGGGTEVMVELLWGPEMLDQRLPMFAGTQDGTPYYDVGHVKVASFRDNVRRLKNNKESAIIKSTFRCKLPATVEEQFSDYDVPAAVATVKYKIASTGQRALCLVLEMMVLRTNYKSTGDIEDFAVDFDSLMI